MRMYQKNEKKSTYYTVISYIHMQLCKYNHTLVSRHLSLSRHCPHCMLRQHHFRNPPRNKIEPMRDLQRACWWPRNKARLITVEEDDVVVGKLQQINKTRGCSNGNHESGVDRGAH